MLADLTYCDFLVLAPLELEVDALENAFQLAGWQTSRPKTNDFLRVFEARFKDTGEAYHQRHAIVIQLNHQGVLQASVDTARALELYDPGYVVSFGIAGTFRGHDAPIGTVVFATQLIYYEPSKELWNDTQNRIFTVHVGDTLYVPFNNLTSPNIKAISGSIASGEKLFADISSTKRPRPRKGRRSARDRIIAATDQIYGVEMEAAGVGLAVERLRKPAEFLVIKGISDLADENKNRIGEKQQTRNRETAAANAATCLVELMRSAPLRRVFRGMPSPAETKLEETARREAKVICDILKPFGISTNYVQLYLCLLDRSGPIPAYFHWDQHVEGLHWIDFKILSALRALPREIVTPIPLVTIEAEGVNLDQTWYSSVEKIIGVAPKIEREIRAELERMSQHWSRIGFSRTAEEEIRSELERMDSSVRPQVTLNLMNYMLGQFVHRRMFVFTWNRYRPKWDNLMQSVGTWFSIFEWDTLTLAGKLGKQESPGREILIEPGFVSLTEWLSTSPSPQTVDEFVSNFRSHFSLFCAGSTEPPEDPVPALRLLMDCWERLFFGGSHQNG